MNSLSTWPGPPIPSRKAAVPDFSPALPRDTLYPSKQMCLCVCKVYTHVLNTNCTFLFLRDKFVLAVSYVKNLV